jgi:hypothetical protein
VPAHAMRHMLTLRARRAMIRGTRRAPAVQNVTVSTVMKNRAAKCTQWGSCERVAADGYNQSSSTDNIGYRPFDGKRVVS